MSTAGWALFLGAILVALVLLGTLLDRLPLSSAMLYLLLGWLLGPGAFGVLLPDPVRHAALLEVAASPGCGHGRRPGKCWTCPATAGLRTRWVRQRTDTAGQRG